MGSSDGTYFCNGLLVASISPVGKRYGCTARENMVFVSDGVGRGEAGGRCRHHNGIPAQASGPEKR